MIVYSERAEPVSPRSEIGAITAALSRIRAGGAESHARLRSLLIRAGELEAGVTDALSILVDEETETVRSFRRLTLALAHAFASSVEERSPQRWLQQAGEAAGRLEFSTVPDPLRLSRPEGYAWYAVFPETYLAAAVRFVSELRPIRAICIGIRGIGASLSAVVAAGLESRGCEVDSFTVRPRGHPFDRALSLAPELRARIRASGDVFHLLVDEGPGLSGSSFGGAARLLAELGVPDDRIIFFPSWDGDGSAFISEDARSRWALHRRFVGSFEDFWTRSHPRSHPPPLRDLSGGAWRTLHYPHEEDYPAVHPQHERRKILAPSGNGEAVLYKFCGLDRRAEPLFDRAVRLAGLGFAPEVRAREDGFLVQEFLEGRPLQARDADCALMRAIGEYLACLRAEFSRGVAASPDELARTLRLNALECLGSESDGEAIEARISGALLALPEVPAIGIDGRMHPHEWIRSRRGIVKTDGVDHHDDHFLPGPQDIAWDLAGTVVEFALEDNLVKALLESYSRRSGDRVEPRRLHFHILAYLACRAGYADLAARTLRAPEAIRWEREFRRYSGELKRRLEMEG